VSRSPRTLDVRAGSPTPEYRRPPFLRTAYTLVGLTLFAAYLISTFPYSQTLTRILAPMGLEVSSTSQRASFPFGAQLSDVRLIPLATHPAACSSRAPPSRSRRRTSRCSRCIRRSRESRALRRRRERHDPPDQARHRYQLRSRLGGTRASTVMDDARSQHSRRAFRNRQPAALSR